MSHSSGLGLLVENMWPLCFDSSSTLSKPVTYAPGGKWLMVNCTGKTGLLSDLTSLRCLRLVLKLWHDFGIHVTHVFEEDAELWVRLWVDSGLKYRKENILQHLTKVWHKVPASEDVTEKEGGQNALILI